MRWLLFATLAVGILSSAFDLARKTVFNGASWNYDYQYWNFVYDPLTVALLVCVFALLLIGLPRLFELPSHQFSAAVYVLILAVFALSLFALPLKMTKALDVGSRGLFDSAVVFVQNGPLAFFESYHSLPGSTPQHPELYIWDIQEGGRENVIAKTLASQLQTIQWLPFNETLAADVAAINVQRHGPISVLLIVPFLYAFGVDTAVAVFGSLVWMAALPVVAYYTYRLYFSEVSSRLAALLVGIAPGSFIWLRHGAPVPYDAFTALLIGVALYAFLRAIQSEGSRPYVLAGVAFSLPAMTKITAVSVLPAFVIMLYYSSSGIRQFARRLGAFTGGAAVIPLGLFAVGYNFVAQYAYTIYKLTLYKIYSTGAGGERPASSPAAALNNDIIGLVGTLYNIRWMNVVLLLLVLVFLVWTAYHYRGVLDETRHVISITLLTAFLPYIVWLVFSTGTLSRHTIILIVPLGFTALSGLTSVDLNTPRDASPMLIRYGQVAVLLTAISYLINI